MKWKTREILVGHVGIGGKNPIRIQSMTTSNTRDAKATADQIMRLADAGCELARVTVQGIKEADACEEIKNILVQHGYTIPLIADIHFYPPAAMRVADFVDKVRINPGNFVDKRAQFKIIEYDDASYAEEILKIEEKFTPLVEKCKRLKRAMRIGTNHGSLSDRIMNRFGDTPEGMVESALEFARICVKNDYHHFLFSMKSSNPKVMILAYRLLVKEMIQIGWDYPLHLGVTEAGEGEDGRIKSAIGIGSLLLDGIGDTIRVSLTEDPWLEIDPCKRLVDFASGYPEKRGEPFLRGIKREVSIPPQLSLHRDGSVVVSKKETFSDPQPDLFASELTILSLEEALLEQKLVPLVAPFQIPAQERKLAIRLTDSFEGLDRVQPMLILLSPEKNRLEWTRAFFNNYTGSVPVILNFRYNLSQEDLIIQAAAECGALLTDGMGDGIWIEAPLEPEYVKSLSFNILQASRMRTFKTDFISCPSCGRTLFDLQEVSRRIRARTAHLPGVKIAIMGCIVNGPGEMADADFGYVGSKPGKIDLYVGKECVERDIDFADADDRLIALLKKHGRWQEAACSSPH